MDVYKLTITFEYPIEVVEPRPGEFRASVQTLYPRLGEIVTTSISDTPLGAIDGLVASFQEMYGVLQITTVPWVTWSEKEPK